MKRLRIICKDGVTHKTRFEDAETGEELKVLGASVTKIEFEPLTPNGFVTAKFTVDFVGLDVEVDLERLEFVKKQPTNG